MKRILIIAFVLISALAKAQTIGIKVAAPIIKNSPSDNTVTGYANLLNGGYHTVTTISGRDSLVSAYSKTLNTGMIAYVSGVDSTYRWSGSSWSNVSLSNYAQIQDGLVSGGDATIGTGSVTIAIANYRINKINYTSASRTFTGIANSPSGTQYYLVVYGKTSSTLDTISGVRANNAVVPNNPANTVRINTILIGDAGISSSMPDLSGYAKLNGGNVFNGLQVFRNNAKINSDGTNATLGFDLNSVGRGGVSVFSDRLNFYGVNDAGNTSFRYLDLIRATQHAKFYGTVEGATPVIPQDFVTKSYGDATYNPTLVSGTNIKTVNSTSLLGSGDISVGTVTSVTSTTTDATVVNPTTTPAITIVSAPKLTTARTIGGTAFDGTANITPALATTVTTNANLTGVITSVGNATSIADATLSIAKTSGLQTALDSKESLLTFNYGLTRSTNTITADTTSATSLVSKSRLTSALNLKANDNQVVHLSGTETITGAKTFTSDVQIPVIPLNSTSAVSKNYIDNAITGITWKAAVRVATTANITLSGTQTIGGIALNVGDRVLVKNQTSGFDNGIYLVSSGTWTRPTDADTGAKIETATVAVTLGTVNANTQWTCVTTGIILGTTPISFGQISGAGTYASGTGLTLTGNVFAIDGTVATLAGTQTLTNKSISGGQITSAVANATLAATATNVAYSGLTGTVPTWNQNTTGNAATVTTNANLTGGVTSVGNATTVVTNANLTGDVTSIGNAATVIKINGTALSGLATGILKNTTATGVPSIAVAGIDYGRVDSIRLVNSGVIHAPIATYSLVGRTAVITQSLNSQIANTFLASPNGAAGTPTFRSIVATDVPTLNQSTTGNAATATNLTGLTTTVSTLNNQSGTNTGDNSTNTTSNSYADAKVQNSLTASTTIAPSATAVNTGLSLKQNSLTLTTTGTSGASTLTGATLNVPQYAGTTYTFSTGLINTSNTITADTTVQRTVLNSYSKANADARFDKILTFGYGLTRTSNTIIGDTISTTGLASKTRLTGALASKESPLTFSSPLSRSVNTISIPVATTSVNGYLSSTDWNTFNGKGSGNGTVTSVAALTLGTTGTDLSSTVSTGTTTPVITLQVPTASALNRGALSSTDWSTFNSKQAAGSYLTANQPITVAATGDATGTSTSSSTAPSLPLTLATVNSNVGTYNNVTVNGKGLVTAASSVAYLNKAGDIITGDIGNTSTGYFTVPSGTTAQRPTTPLDGMRRYNNTTLRDEFYANGSWQNHARLTGDTFTGSVTAPTFVGALTGNASTATSATNVTGIVAVANGGTGSSTGETLQTITNRGNLTYNHLILERVSLQGTALGFNRDVTNGTIFSNTGYAYQFNQTRSTTPSLDKLALQIYNPSGAGLGEALTIFGSLNLGVGYTTDQQYKLAVNGTGIFSDKLTLKAGTTSSSPLRIPSGVAPTTPIDGDIWRLTGRTQLYDGTQTKDVIFDKANSVLSGFGVGAVVTDNLGNLSVAPSADRVISGVITKTSAYTVTLSDVGSNGTVLVRGDATSAAFTITLPVASTTTGLTFIIKKIDSSANGVTVSVASTIDGTSTKVFNTQYSGASIMSNGTSYNIVATF